MAVLPDSAVAWLVLCDSVNTHLCKPLDRERSGSVVECLIRDRGAGGSSLLGVTALCP